MMRSKEKNFFKKKKNGFTLIEILIVVAIIGMLSAIVFINFQERQDKLTLQRSVHELSLNIARVRELALRAEVSEGYLEGYPLRGSFGAHFKIGANYYVLFADANENRIFDTMELYENIELEEGVIITSLPQNYPLTIVFIPPDPVILINEDPLINNATITLGINELTASVFINNAGLIYIK
jgi:prepilin-type N-terminal cleavage/methylation domain-containing protein